MSMEWIEHKGKRILYINYARLSSAENIAQIDAAVQVLIDSGRKDNLTLTDLRDAVVDQDFVNHSKEKAKISAAYTKKAAILGVEGVRKVLLKAVNAFSGNPRVPFDSLEAAKDWLAED